MLWWRIFCLCQTYQRDKLLPNHIVLFVAKSFWAFSLKNYLLQNCDILSPTKNCFSQKFFDRFLLEIVSRKSATNFFHLEITCRKNSLTVSIGKLFLAKILWAFSLGNCSLQKCDILLLQTFAQLFSNLIYQCSPKASRKSAAGCREFPKPSCKSATSFRALTMASYKLRQGFGRPQNLPAKLLQAFGC